LEFSGFTPLDFLRRHVTGDDGDLSEEDKIANRSALTTGGRIFSAYNLAGRERLWIITESDRSSTCLLLPEEY
jgi:hypothetical protein